MFVVFVLFTEGPQSDAHLLMPLSVVWRRIFAVPNSSSVHRRARSSAYSDG